jgi:TctA family transporter
MSNNTDATVPQEHLFVLLVSALRYAMGRRSYITGQTADIVRGYFPCLSSAQRDVVARDIARELDVAVRLGKTVGDTCDHVVWVALLDTLINEHGVRDYRTEVPK